MTITRNGATELQISGSITSIDDSIVFREEAQKIITEGHTFLTLRFHDAFALPSAVIGYLMKIAGRDKITVGVVACNPKLAQLLEELQLTQMFGVRQL